MKEIIISPEEKNIIQCENDTKDSNCIKEELLNKLHTTRDLSGYEIKMLLEALKES